MASRSSNSVLKRSASSVRMASNHGSISGGALSNTWKIVFDALVYQDSGSRTDRMTRASGLAAANSGQNEAPGQSTWAT